MKRKRLFSDLEAKKLAIGFASLVPTWEQIWKTCWPKVRARRPDNWSLANWRDLMLAEAWEATWLALLAFDARKGMTLDAYIGLSVQNALTAAARQERRYASHLNVETAHELAARVLHRDEPCADKLERLLGQLTEGERLLVAEFFLSGKTEAQLGVVMHKSQSWVNKQKSKLLNKMRKIGEKWGG